MAKAIKAKRVVSPDRLGTIYRALRRAIIEQALEPGAKLPEDAIGERFGASRTIVRHALGQLAAEGLVELRRNKGAAVATPSWDQARDIFDVRIAMERLVMQRLAGNLTRAQTEQLKAHVAEEEKARGRDEPLSIRLATEFHIVLAEMTGSVVLERYVSEVSSRCGLILALYSRPHSSECAVSEHRQIIDALAKGDAARAIAVMDQHLEAVASRALKQDRLREREIGRRHEHQERREHRTGQSGQHRGKRKGDGLHDDRIELWHRIGEGRSARIHRPR